ncbi:MAG TPA: hypothetical protein VFD19_04155 [Clostridia bacterium]|nr:hypothetical protein [Clostridia bacterium]
MTVCYDNYLYLSVNNVNERTKEILKRVQVGAKNAQRFWEMSSFRIFELKITLDGKTVHMKDFFAEAEENRNLLAVGSTEKRASFPDEIQQALAAMTEATEITIRASYFWASGYPFGGSGYDPRDLLGILEVSDADHVCVGGWAMVDSGDWIPNVIAFDKTDKGVRFGTLDLVHGKDYISDLKGWETTEPVMMLDFYEIPDPKIREKIGTLAQSLMDRYDHSSDSEYSVVDDIIHFHLMFSDFEDVEDLAFYCQVKNEIEQLAGYQIHNGIMFSHIEEDAFAIMSVDSLEDGGCGISSNRVDLKPVQA